MFSRAGVVAAAAVLLAAPAVAAGGSFVLEPLSMLFIDASVALNKPVNSAILDFQRDWYKVIGTVLSTQSAYISGWDGGCIVSMYQDNKTLAAESFSVVAINGTVYPELRITGGDMRGLIYGLYHVSGDFLGVDPFWWHYDIQPAYAGAIDVPADYSYFSGAPAFTNRGAFFNDEDLLGFYFQDPLGESVYDSRTASFFAETLLRLRLNVLIPSTFAFPSESHYRVASARGLKLGNHHVQPMNLNVFAWPKGVSYSYRQNPESFHSLWGALIDYQQNLDGREMVYSVGLRGVNDNPYWQEDTLCSSVECAGAIISAAIANQTLLALSTPATATGKPPQLVSYLWMELLPLLNAGTLKFPEGVTVVFTDYPGSFNIDATNATNTSGMYVHLQMMNGQGGQTTEFIPMRRAFNGMYCFWEKNATSYAMINLSDLRPVPLGSEAAYRYLFDPQSFNGTAIRALNAGGHVRKSGGSRAGRRGPVNWWPSATNPATWGGREAMEAALRVEGGPVTPQEAQDAFHLEFATRHFGGGNASVPQAVADIYTAYFNMPFLAPDGINTDGDHYFGNTLRGLVAPFLAAVEAGSRNASLAAAAAPVLAYADSNLPYVGDLFLNRVLPTAAYIAPGQQSFFYSAHVVMQTAVYYHHLLAFRLTALGADAWVAGDDASAFGNVTLALAAVDDLLRYLRVGEGQGVWRGVFQYDRWTWMTGSRSVLARLLLRLQGLEHGPAPGPDPYTDYAIMAYEGQPNDPLGIAGRSFPFSTFNQSIIALDVSVRVWCQDDAPAPYGSGGSSGGSCATNWVGATFSGASASLVLFTAPHPLRTPFTPPTIRYTLDGSVPTPASPAYNPGTPVVVTSNATLTAQAFEAGTGAALAYPNVATIIQQAA